MTVATRRTGTRLARSSSLTIMPSIRRAMGKMGCVRVGVPSVCRIAPRSSLGAEPGRGHFFILGPLAQVRQSLIQSTDSWRRATPFPGCQVSCVARKSRRMAWTGCRPRASTKYDGGGSAEQVGRRRWANVVPPHLAVIRCRRHQLLLI